jgi:hypothetical protein
MERGSKLVDGRASTTMTIEKKRLKINFSKIRT